MKIILNRRETEIEIIDNPIIPKDAGMITVEKQDIMFKIEDGKLKVWMMPDTLLTRKCS